MINDLHWLPYHINRSNHHHLHKQFSMQANLPFALVGYNQYISAQMVSKEVGGQAAPTKKFFIVSNESRTMYSDIFFQAIGVEI